MPRNVVTVVRRRSLFRRRKRRARQDHVLAQLGERHRVRWRTEGEGVEIDFPKSLGRREAKGRIVADLARIDPDWAHLLVVYPADRNLRDYER